MTKLKENLIAFVWAIILTFVAILFINHSGTNFATDVLWKQSANNQTDLSLVKSGSDLLLISNKNIENVASMTAELMFNPEKVNLTKDNLNSIFDIAVQEKNPWNYYIMLTNIWEIKKWQVLINIKNAKKNINVNINFGHIQVIDNNGNILNLTLLK